MRYTLLRMDEHGIQSSYISNFYQFALKQEKVEVEKIEEIRNVMLFNDEEIPFKTLGAPSTLRQSHRLSSIANKGVSSKAKSALLKNIASYFQCERVLELGTSIGINTLYLSISDSIQQVTSIEGNARLAEIAKSNFEQCDINSIEVIVGEIGSVLNTLDTSFDLIFIDANHTYSATIEYFQWASEHLNSGGAVIFDDINWSGGMSRAWYEISKSKRFTAIENFDLGIILDHESEYEKPYVLSF